MQVSVLLNAIDSRLRGNDNERVFTNHVISNVVNKKKKTIKITIDKYMLYKLSNAEKSANINVREAGKGDLDELSTLAHYLNVYEAQVDPHLRVKVVALEEKKIELVEALQEKKTKILIAEEGERIVGYILGRIEERKSFEYEKVGYINSCYIVESDRGKNISTYLTNSIIKWFKSNDITVVELGVLYDSLSASIWRKLGFQDYYIKMRRII